MAAIRFSLDSIISEDVATEQLAIAIKKNDVELAKTALNEGALVNGLIPRKISQFFDDITPLQLTIALNVNYSLILLLLENNADPNVLSFKKCSTLECLFRGLLLKCMENDTGHIQENNLMPIPLEEMINLAEKILNLLLCYGLDTNQKWTEDFSSHHNSIQKSMDIHTDLLLRNKYSNEITKIIANFALENENKTPSYMTKITNFIRLSAVTVYIKFLDLNKEILSPYKHTHEYLETIETMPIKLQKTGQAIKREKGDLLNQYHKQFSLGTSNQLGKDVATLIFQYINLNQIIAQTISNIRSLEPYSARFWSPAKQHAEKFNEIYKEAYLKAYEYRHSLKQHLKLSFFSANNSNKNLLTSEGIFKLISEYTIEPSNEDLKNPSLMINY